MKRVDVGTTVYPTIEFLDAYGSPYDPESVTLFIKRPDLEESSVPYSSLTKLSTGRYRHPVLIDEPGRFICRYEGYSASGSIAQSKEIIYTGNETAYTPPRPVVNPPDPLAARWSPITATPCPMDVALTPGEFKTGATTVVHTKIAHRLVGASSLGLRLLFGWWYGEDSLGEVMLTNGGTIRAWVVDAAGTHYPVMFGALLDETSYTFDPDEALPDYAMTAILATEGLPEWVEFSSPKNVIAAGAVEGEFDSAEMVHVVVEVTVANAAHFIPGGLRLLSAAGTDGYTSLGEGAGVGVYTPGVTEVALTGESGAYGPLAVMGHGLHPSCAIVGDSIWAGTGGVAIRQGLCGPAYRALTGQTSLALDTEVYSTCGVMMLAKGGEALYQAVDPELFKYRMIAMALASVRNILCNYGTNDLSGGRTVAQVKADTLAFTKTFSDMSIRTIWNPLAPRTNSTDGWYTIENQTPVSEADRTTMRSWMVDGDYELEALANGSPSNMVKVSNMSAGISCDDLGAPDPIGSYFLPDQGPPGGYFTFLVNSPLQLSFASFRDSANLIAPFVSTNSLRGLTARINIGVYAEHQQSIRYNKASNGLVSTGAFGNDPLITHAEGDSGIICALMTDDGTHPLDPAARLMALEFDPNLLLGTRQSVVPPGLPQWEPAQQTLLAHYDVRQTETLFQDSALTTPAVASLDPVGGWLDLAVTRAGRNLLQATAGNRFALDTDLYNDKPFVISDGVDDFMRWDAPASTVVGASASATQEFTDASEFRVGDSVYFHVSQVTKKIIGKSGNDVTFDSAFGVATTAGEAVRATMPQPVTYLMVLSVETPTASAVLFSGAGGGADRHQFFMTNPGALTFTLNAGIAVTLGTVSPDEPVFIALVVNGNLTKIYQNGLLVGVAVNPGGGSNSGFTLAANNAGAPSGFSNIAYGEVILVSGAMSAYDIARAHETYFAPIWGL